jgi:hypothetical protein
MSDTINLLNRWVVRHGVAGEYMTELTFHVLNGGTIDGYHEEQRRASDMGRVLEGHSNGSGNRDAAILGIDVL